MAGVRRVRASALVRCVDLELFLERRVVHRDELQLAAFAKLVRLGALRIDHRHAVQTLAEIQMKEQAAEDHIAARVLAAARAVGASHLRRLEGRVADVPADAIVGFETIHAF